MPDSLSQAFRALGNRIDALLKNKESGVSLWITSCMPGEGKTVIANCLGREIAARAGHRVVIVDMDFRAAPRRSKRESSQGLWGYLSDSAALPSVVAQTDVERLHVLPPGTGAYEGNGTIEAGRLAGLLDELEKEFSHVIIDTPALGDCPEAGLLAQRVDGVILVVQAEKTRREIVLDAKKSLDALKANILGVVLNRRKCYIPKMVYTRI